MKAEPLSPASGRITDVAFVSLANEASTSTLPAAAGPSRAVIKQEGDIPAVTNNTIPDSETDLVSAPSVEDAEMATEESDHPVTVQAKRKRESSPDLAVPVPPSVKKGPVRPKKPKPEVAPADSGSSQEDDELEVSASDEKESEAVQPAPTPAPAPSPAVPGTYPLATFQTDFDGVSSSVTEGSRFDGGI